MIPLLLTSRGGNSLNGEGGSTQHFRGPLTDTYDHRCVGQPNAQGRSGRVPEDRERGGKSELNIKE